VTEETVDPNLSLKAWPKANIPLATNGAEIKGVFGTQQVACRS
jgi:hypothetical protein